MAGWRDPAHLPNRRPDRQPPPASRLPRQRRGVTPQMVGRYPDHDVLAPDVLRTWDDETRDVVLARLRPRCELQFFTPDEEPAARALCDVLLAQDGEPRVPVVELLDAKYAEGRLDGYRHADMPDDGEAWHRVLAGLDHTARTEGSADRFADLDVHEQRSICERLKDGELTGGPWDRLDVRRAWLVVVRTAASEFYAHPWAWNEIGFGGPAYPRGFMRMGPISVREPFEAPAALDPDPVGHHPVAEDRTA